MIARTHRFHGHHSLNQVYRTGKGVRAEFLSLRYLHTKRDDYRLAVVVSKKVSKSAVVRNRIRRRIYEIVRVAKKEASQPWPYDLVISVFDERLATMTASEIEQSVLGLLKKARIIT
jgi:ribonuclease P protein component